MKTLFLLLMPALLLAQSSEYSFIITRPSNGTAYTAGDVVCATDSLPFQLVPDGAMFRGRITQIELAADTVNVTNAAFTLLLFKDSTGLGKIADNAAFANSMARDSFFVGSYAFTLAVTGSAGGTVAWQILSGASNYLDFVCYARGNTTKGLWGRLIATGAYVPKFVGRFRVRAIIQQ